MAKTATTPAPAKKKKAPAKPKPRNSEIIEIDLGDAGKAILDKMSEFRVTRLAAEREEKLLKTQLGELIDSTLQKEQKPHQKLTVRAAGVIRGTRGWRGRRATDYDLLLQGWPEAFEKCTSENEYTQFDPA